MAVVVVSPEQVSSSYDEPCLHLRVLAQRLNAARRLYTTRCIYSVHCGGHLYRTLQKAWIHGNASSFSYRPPATRACNRIAALQRRLDQRCALRYGPPWRAGGSARETGLLWLRSSIKSFHSSRESATTRENLFGLLYVNWSAYRCLYMRNNVLGRDIVIEIGRNSRCKFPPVTIPA